MESKSESIKNGGIGIELELDTQVRPESNSESESIRSVGIELGVGIDVNRIDSAALQLTQTVPEQRDGKTPDRHSTHVLLIFVRNQSPS